MANGRCLYICTPMSLLDRQDIPKDSPVWWRYQMCLKEAWVKTSTAYAYFYASNRELAELWQVNEETARKGLAELVKYRLVETEQVNKTDRIIRILVAWRGQGKDSAPEPRFRVSKVEANAPDARAPRLAEHQAPAAGVPTRTEDLDDAEGGKQTTTLARAPTNAAAVVVFDELVFAGKRPAATGLIITRTRDQCERIRDALWDLGLCEEDVQEEALRLRYVTTEYVEDWTLHRQLNPKMRAGYYRLQIRERRQSPYQMSAQQRREYRERKDREWEEHVAEERMERHLSDSPAHHA